MDDFDEIYELYFKDVYRYLRGITLNETLAEELTEETFFKAFSAIKDFRGESEIRVWLCQIAKNNYYSYLKRQSKAFPVEDSPDEFYLNGMLEDLIDKERIFEIHKILHNLEEPYREIFMLRVFGELSFKQIGKLFEKNEHWACVVYHRAKEKIQYKITNK